MIICDLKQHSTTISIAAIYAPNHDSPEFFKNLRGRMKNREEHKIIVGDFNLVLDNDLDRLNTYNNNNKAKQQLEDLCDEYYMEEVWRTQNGNKREYSWKKGNTYPTKASRIDFALITKGLDQDTETIQYISSIFTDHRALYMVIKLNPLERGKGYWKFNNTLLQNSNFLQEMQEELRRTIASVELKEPDVAWELIKKRIKTKTAEFSKRVTKENQIIISNLSEKLNEYESNLPLNQADTDLMEKTRIDLEDKTMEKIKGTMFRSKAKWYEEGEKSSKYFFSLEKAKYNSKTCHKLITEDGRELNTNEEILEAQKTFYAELYEKDKDVNFTLENSYGIKVPAELKENQEIQLEIQDLEKAIKGMNNNKTPGEDGIPVDFYKVFWRDLKLPFYNMMLHTFQEKQLHETARKGILNLIPKPGKDSRIIRNLRPITLLNTDYKIIEKAIANKMIPALDHIIHTDQRGFMKDRRISVNIRKMLDIMHQTEQEDLEAVVMSLDFVKCFDKCSFSILHGSLEFFGFGSIVKDWTKILYKGYTVRVQNNGHFSQPISIEKGVHQGGCCSSIYFLVIAEILALSLRDNKDIDGITWQNIKNLLNQFADDMDIFSLAKEKSIKTIFEELDRFKRQSGFTVSYEKTTVYRIGSLRHSSAELYNMSQYAWSNKDITVLDVTITHDDLLSKNYTGIIEKARKILYSWQNRGISLIGKVQVINTLIASLFVYKMMVLPMIPKAMIKNLDNLVREYLWDGGKAKIALEVLQNPKNEGGLNLVNFHRKEVALKATWPFILQKEEQYAKLVYKIMRMTTIEQNIWKCRIHPKDVHLLKIKSQFWEDTLRCWCEYNYYNYRVENQIIWYNSSIKIGGHLIFWKHIFQHGLLYVHQLFQNGDYKTQEQVLQEFQLTTMKYNSIKTAIPKEWKEFFCQTEKSCYHPLPPHNYDQTYSLGNKFSQIVYRYTGGDVITIHNKYLKWMSDLGEEICDGIINFGKLHRDIYKTTNITKFRSFQYRLLQRGIVTNIQLKKWKITPTDLCSFCQSEPESLLHLFFYCPKVLSLWHLVVSYIQDRFGLDPELNPRAVISNQFCQAKAHASNFICLITKQYIYRQRCMKKELIFNELKAHIHTLECIEKYIAIKNGKFHHHTTKWKPM